MTTIPDLSGNSAGIDPTFTQSGISLAKNVASLAGNAATAPFPGVRRSPEYNQGGNYVWDAVFGGTTPSLKLQALASDGATWRDIATMSASGVASVYIGAGATVRLLNATANAITGLSSTIS